MFSVRVRHCAWLCSGPSKHEIGEIFGRNPSKCLWHGRLTFSDGEVRDSLPFIHRYAPATFHTTTAQVNDQLAGIATELCKHRLQTIEGECARGEKERGDDDLPQRENISQLLRI